MLLSGVGLFHIWAHIPKCQRAFSCIQTTLAGLTDGELAVGYLLLRLSPHNWVARAGAVLFRHCKIQKLCQVHAEDNLVEYHQAGD